MVEIKEEIDNWDAPVEVGERIIDLLSGKVYRSLPNAIKELISNAWDADADNVRVKIDVNKKVIMISDDGIGMDKAGLKGYPSVAVSNKSEGKTPGNRPYIGSFGIGIFSALAFCRNIIVETTIENSDDIHILEISSDKWIDADGRHKQPSNDHLKEIFHGYSISNPIRNKEHGTTITMSGLFPADWSQLINDTDEGSNGILDLKNYLCQATPIEYADVKHPYKDFFGSPTDYKSMSLFFNDERLYRSAVWCSDGTPPRVLECKEHLEFGNGAVICKYIIVSPLENVKPEIMGGLQKRMQNVAIGDPDLFDVYKKSGKLSGRMKYITGELHIIKGLENQLNLERGAIITCPEYTELSKFFEKKLMEMAGKLEHYAESEKILGALAYLDGTPIKKAKYGFLADDSVRDRTKTKLVPQGKEKLVAELSKHLNKTGYQIQLLPDEIGHKISVDHENKKVILVGNADDESYAGIPIYTGNIPKINGGPRQDGTPNKPEKEDKNMPEQGAFFTDIDIIGKISSKKDEVDLLVVLRELHLLSTTKIKRRWAYEVYPTSAAMLLRSAYEQSLWLLLRRAKLMRDLTKQYGPEKEIIKLSDLEDFLSKKKDIAPTITKEIRTRYASVERLMHRKILNDIVHSPGKVKATATSVEDLCKGGLFQFIQEVVDYRHPDDESEQK